MQKIPALIPYEEDELFFSWFYRLSMHNYAINLNSFANNYLDYGKFTDTRHTRAIKYDFRENLNNFQRAAMFENDEFAKIFFDTSLFYATVPFMNDLSKGLYLMLALTKLERKEEEVLLSTLRPITEKIEFCPECMKNEQKEYGYYWFHRAHQLPSVKVCHKHHCPLMVYTGIPGKEFILPIKTKQVVEEVHSIEIEYSRFCKDFLDIRLDTDIYTIKDICIKRCEKLGYHEMHYGSLDDAVHNSECAVLFNESPSFFMTRKEMDGTFFDFSIGLPLLFFLFKNAKIVEKYVSLYAKNVEKDKMDNNDNIKKRGYIIEKEHGYGLVSIYHKKCEKTFFITNNGYFSSYTCPSCNKNINSLIHQLDSINDHPQSKYGVNHGNVRTEKILKMQIIDLVGDEYELAGDYVVGQKKIDLLHRQCGHIMKIKTLAFLDGGRCSFCKTASLEKEFIDFVQKVSKGRYIVRGKATYNLRIIHDTDTNKDIVLTKDKALQELNKKSKSDILPLKKDSEQRHKYIIAKIDELLEWMKKKYSKNEPIFMEDIVVEGFSHKQVKGRIRTLIRNGKLERVVKGIYCFPGTQITNYDLLMSNYLIRNGTHIGYYYGKSFGYTLGLCDEPERKCIVSNKEGTRHGRKATMYGLCIKIRGALTEITDENYQVLQMLEFITSARLYTHQKLNVVEKRLIEYVIQYSLEEAAVQKYIDLFPIWTKMSVERIFSEVHKNAKKV